ncbi:hypothetical protein Plhal703r1_c47g0150321 [Plasmopara halstedii]
MTSARGTQQRIHSGNCDDSNNSQLCSQLASTWGPENRCLAVAAVDEGAESADCVEGVAGAILSEIVQKIDQAAALRTNNPTSYRASETNSGLATVTAGLVEDVELADGKEDRVAVPQEVRALPMTDIITLPEAAQSTMRTEALGMQLRSGRAKLHAPGNRKTREPVVRSGLTTMAYPIVIITDRRDEPERGRCYRVRFKDGSEDWLCRRGLEEDGNTQDCDFVDAWYDLDKCRTKPFCRFLKGLPGYRSHQKAGEDADCVRLAVNAIYERKGWAPLVSREDWETFLKAKNISLDEGLGMRKLGVLLKWIEENGNAPNLRLDRGYFAKKANLFNGRCDGVDGIFDLELECGMYLVNCDLSETLSHCMALEVLDKTRSHQVYDQHSWIGLIDKEEWLYRVRGVYHAAFMGDSSPPSKKCKTSYKKPREKVKPPKTL